MVESLRHEPSYGTGIWADEKLGVYVGWAERDQAVAARMPVFNEGGDIALVFSGEEFPAAGTREGRKADGHDVAAHGPSYLVHDAGDPHFPAGLNGRFHGLLIHRNSGRIILFNDRYGMHRIYYHECGDAFYFAAEAKAILRVRPELRSTDARGLGDYIACGCVLENRTLFKGIHVLPTAAAWEFQNAALSRKGAYFDPQEWENQTPLDPERYYQELRGVFSDTLPRYFNGSGRVAVSLTGGLDTRMIMAWHKAPHGTLPCYSFGGMFRECQDVVIARRVAQTCGQPHSVIEVGAEFLSRFPYYAERTVYLTDGCVGVNHSPDLYVNKIAAEIAPVRMTGNYGGEVLRCVRAFKPWEPAPGLFHPEVVANARAARETYEGLLKEHPLSFAVFRQAPWHHFGLLSLEETQLTLRSPYLDNEFVKTLYRAPESAVTSNAISLRLIADGDQSLLGIRTDRGLAGNQGRLLSSAIRNALEFTFKAEYAYDYGMPQWVAYFDHLMSPLHLERLFLGRHKFYHFRIWYRDTLSAYVREALLDPRSLSRSYVERNRAETIVKEHVSGVRNHTTEIHTLLSLELMHRQLLDVR